MCNGERLILQTLNGAEGDDEGQGGAIMFMTDGDQVCKNSAGLDIDDKSVIDRIIRTKVRIITVAIG